MIVKEKLEAILHPIRMRILQTLLNGKRMTAQQIKAKLIDVAVPTLYRHLNALVENQIIVVVEENQIRGTVEKVYALPAEDLLSDEDLMKATPEDHRDYFLTFITGLLSQFNEYIGTGNAEPLVDNLGYRQIHLYLSDEEFREMFKVIGDSMLRNIDNQPHKDRKLYSISTIVIPDSINSEGEK